MELSNHARQGFGWGTPGNFADGFPDFFFNIDDPFHEHIQPFNSNVSVKPSQCNNIQGGENLSHHSDRWHIRLLSDGVKDAPTGPEPVEEIVALTKAVRRQMRREKWKPS